MKRKNKTIEIERAECNSLLKKFNLQNYREAKGFCVLLIPDTEGYRPETYGYGELKVFSYLQEHFNRGERIGFRRVLEILKSNKKYDLLEDEKKEGFLSEVLSRFSEDEVVNIEKKNVERKRIQLEDILSAGKNYDIVRICCTTNRQ